MHAYLLVNPTSSFVGEKIKEIAPDARTIHFSLEKIADTRELVRQTNMAFAKKTAYVLDNFDAASTEAQNAFLKRLEEPADDLLFFLIAKNESRVLPTIASRCEIVRMTRNKVKIDESDNALSFINSKTPDRFAEISKITKREDAVVFLEKLINSLHKNLPNGAKNLELADETLARINQNANPTLQLTRLAIGLQ
jgi:prefoldin subunit 5